MDGNIDGYVVHFDTHLDGYDGWVDPENFRILSQWIAGIDVYVDVDFVIAYAHCDGYDGWVDLENFIFIP